MRRESGSTAINHGKWDGSACVSDDVNWYHGEFCEVEA